MPIGVNTSIEGNQLTLIGMVASLDGQQLLKDSVTGDRTNAEKIGQELAEKTQKSRRRRNLSRYPRRN